MAEPASTFETGLDRVWNEIRDLGLTPYVAELDAKGYTVIPPEIANPNGLCERMLEAILDIAERRNGERPDMETGATHAHLGVQTTAQAREQGRGKLRGRLPSVTGKEIDSPHGDLMQSIYWEDPVFEESIMNPVLLAMAAYLCGYGVILSTMGCWMKGPNYSNFSLHTDSPMPSPMPSASYVCQCTYVLTDYNRENGATAFVPGSHKWCRQPVGREAIVGEGGNEQAIPVEARAGSLLVWHGNTWHGAVNRTALGLRVGVTNFMVRPFIKPQEDFIGRIPREVLDRNPARFAIMMQQGTVESRHSPEDGQRKVARAAKFTTAYAKEVGQTGPRPIKDLYT